MREVLWVLGVGPLLVTLWAVPIGKFLLSSSMDPSEGGGSADAETLGCEDLLPRPAAWVSLSPEVGGISWGRRASGLQST